MPDKVIQIQVVQLNKLNRVQKSKKQGPPSHYTLLLLFVVLSGKYATLLCNDIELQAK